MNRRLPYLVLIFSLVLLPIQSFSQVGIGILTPDASAILDVNSSDKGFLPPRMTETQRDAIGGGLSCDRFNDL